MRTLLLLRHAKSRWDREGISDHDRPLKKRGKRDACRVGWLLVQQDCVPQLIVSSTAKRARGTAKRVARACNYAGEITLDHALYQAGPTGYLRMLQCMDDRYHRIMVVGHNPGIELLLEVLTGVSEAFRPAGLAAIELPINAWDEIQEFVGGELVGLWGPDQLKDVAKPDRADWKDDADEDEAFVDNAFESGGIEDDGFTDEDYEDEDHEYEDNVDADNSIAVVEDERVSAEDAADEGIRGELPATDTDLWSDRPSSFAS
jgi:phosphohistidine phosphatase